MNIKALSVKQMVSIVVVFVLLIGLGVGVYLVQRQQTMKSKAAAGSFVNAFEIKDNNGNVITCDGSTYPPTCTTPTLDISVKVNDKTLLLPVLP